jgi:hypothetical protein
MKHSIRIHDLSLLAQCINQLRHRVYLTIGNVCKNKASPHDMHSAGAGGRPMYNSNPSQPRLIKGLDDQHKSHSLYPRERPSNYCTGGWVGLMVGLQGHGNFPTGIRSPNGSVCRLLHVLIVD